MGEKILKVFKNFNKLTILNCSLVFKKTFLINIKKSSCEEERVMPCLLHP